MQIELAQFSTIPCVNMDRITLKCQFSLAFTLVMRYVRRRKIREDGKDENSEKVLGVANASRANKL